jgi:UrcA family protein
LSVRRQSPKRHRSERDLVIDGAHIEPATRSRVRFPPQPFRVAKGRFDMQKAIPALAALVAAAMLVVPTVSQAAETNSVRVSYADLNLASDAGRHVFEGRIVTAARVVCEFEDSRDLALASATNACRSDAVERAQPAFEAAVASAVHPSVTVGAAAIVVSAR